MDVICHYKLAVWVLKTSRTIIDRRGRSKGEGEEKTFSFSFIVYRETFVWGLKIGNPGCHFPRFGVYLFRDSTVQLFLSQNPRNCCTSVGTVQTS